MRRYGFMGRVKSSFFRLPLRLQHRILRLDERMGTRLKGFRLNLLRKLINVSPFSWVCHVGAHYGEESPLYAHLGAERIVWVEAHPELAKQLQARVMTQRDGPKQYVYWGAATALDGGYGELIEMSNRERTAFGCSSLSKPGPAFDQTIDFPIEATGRSHKVPLRTLTSILGSDSGELFGKPDGLLVIDVQGHELEVLRGCSPQTLGSFKAIIVEVSTVEMYEGCPAVADVVDLLAAAGFEPVSDIPVLHGDVLFVRSP